MKTIVITSFHALISRNILQTRVLEALEESGARVVLVVPEGKTDYFKEAFGSERVVVEGVVVPKRPLEDALYLFSMSLVGTENHIVRGWKTEGKFIKYYAAQALHTLCGRLFFMHKALRALAAQFLSTEVFEPLFANYAPDLVCTTDTFNREDRTLILAAKRHGVRTVGLIRSWDNATTKGVLLGVPDRVVVTNEVLAEEMHDIHGVSPEAITVTGVPHYDNALSPRLTAREEFFKTMGLNPTKKTILFAPGGKILYAHDREMFSMLKQLNDAGAFGHAVQFLVRLPPSDIADTSSVAGDPAFVIDTPGTNVTGRKKESELSSADNQRLVDSLSHCDVLVTLVSTMVIDAAVYGKPSVVIGFEPAPGLSDPVAKFAKYKHFEKMLATGFVAFPKSEEAFAEKVRTYLATPETDADKRDALLARYAYRLDGSSGERVAAAILSEVPR